MTYLSYLSDEQICGIPNLVKYSGTQLLFEVCKFVRVEFPRVSFEHSLLSDLTASIFYAPLVNARTRLALEKTGFRCAPELCILATTQTIIFLSVNECEIVQWQRSLLVSRRIYTSLNINLHQKSLP